MSADTEPFRVLLVDDQELVRSGLKRILRARDGLQVVAECTDGSEVPATLAAQPSDVPIDVIVMDLRMRGVDGIEATRHVRGADGPPVLVLTTFDDDEMLSGALRAGANGFILKDSSAEDLVAAVRTVAEGGSWLDPAVTERVLTRFRESADVPATGAHEALLTSREQEVLHAMGCGLTNAEIAATLFISELTVKSHIGRIFVKLGLRDRAAAVVYAFDHGIVRPGDADRLRPPAAT